MVTNNPHLTFSHIYKSYIFWTNIYVVLLDVIIKFQTHSSFTQDVEKFGFVLQNVNLEGFTIQKVKHIHLSVINTLYIRATLVQES